jgi:hypothetical protein
MFLPTTDLVPIDEIEERLAIIQDTLKAIHGYDPDWILTAIHVSIFMLIPLATLRVLRRNLVMTSMGFFLWELGLIHQLTAHCKVPLVSKYAWAIN